MGEVKINLDTTPQDDSVKKQNPPQKPKDETKVKDKQDGSRKPNEDKEYISSLFNHNPEIPTIEQSEFEPTKEDVFSVKTFDNLNLNPHLVKNLSELGLTTLTTIQSKALPVIMGGKDALIKSQTGSGKTMTYAIPIMQKLGSCEPRIDRKSGCFALVIVPTRELAVQSYEWFQKLCKAFIWVVPCLPHVHQVKVPALVQWSVGFPLQSDVREGCRVECCQVILGVVNKHVVSEGRVKREKHDLGYKKMISLAERGQH